MMGAKKGRQTSPLSPESQISPYEDINTRQFQISGETFPVLSLGICDKCKWCYSSTNSRGIIRVCPMCKGDVSQIPMTIDEICSIEVDENRGLTLAFDRRLPLR